jgi:glycine/serine hydroxymethyltransferase
MQRIAELIDRVLMHPEDPAIHSAVRADVRKLTDAFPLYV